MDTGQSDKTGSASTPQFDAFISYSRKDGEFARSLEKALRAYVPPRDLPVPQRRFSIFRDQSDVLGVELTQALQSNLRASTKLIVLCSPDSRRSSYVNGEIEVFGRLRGAQHIIPVLVRGIPNNEARSADEPEMAFPTALVTLLPTPLAAEFRGFRPSKDRLGRGVFEQPWYKLLADVYADFGITRAQVEQREKRRRARQRAIAISVTACVMVALLALTVWALFERKEAIRQRNTAVSRYVATQSIRLVNEQPDLGLLLGAAAYQTAPTLEARQSLQANLLQRPRLERFLWGHKGTITTVAFSPDGRLLASGGDDKKTVVWDATTGGALYRVTHADKVQRVAFSPDGRRLFSATKDGRVLVLSATNGAEIRLLIEINTNTFLATFALSPDGRRLVTALWDGTLALWDPESGVRLGEVTPHSEMISAVVFAPDGKTIASSSWDETAALWDGSPEHHPQILTGHTKGTKSVAFAPGGRVLAAPFELGKVNLWNVEDGKLLATLTATNAGHKPSEGASVAFSPDARWLAASGTLAHSITIWNLDSRQPVTVLAGHRSGVHAIRFSRDGRRFASVGGDGMVRIWETERWSLLAEEEGGHSCLEFSPDGRHLATGGSGHAALWCVEEPAIARILQQHAEQVGHLQFSPDGNSLASASWDGDVAVSDLRGRRNTVTYQPPKEPGAEFEPVLHGKGLRVFAFSPDGKTLATGGRQGKSFGEGGRRGDLAIWNFAGTGQVTMLEGHRSGIRAIAFTPDGRDVAAADSKSIRLWNLTSRQARILETNNGALCMAFTRKRLAAGSADNIMIWDLTSAGSGPVVLRGHNRPVNCLVSSPAGERLISGSFDGTIRVWDTSRPSYALVRICRHTADITDLEIGPDARIFVSGSRDQTVGVWDTQTGAPLYLLRGHDSEIASVAVSADGKTLGSAGANGSVILWDADTGTELVRLGRKAAFVSFSPRGPSFATAGGPENQVVFWGIPIDNWAAHAASVANRSLTREEWKRYLGDLPYLAESDSGKK